MKLNGKLIPFLFFSTPLLAANITSAWFTNGTAKMARQDLFPFGCTSSTCTITRNWDGTTAQLFGARNETVFGMFYLLNNTASDATQVNVQISSFTGPAGYGITPVVVSSGNVWDANASGPINLFYVRYLQIRGATQESWDGTEYEERDVPKRFQVPYTVNGNNQGVVTGAILWANKPDHDKFYPDILVPYEEIQASSFTVSASSSQAIGIDIYIAKTLPAGIYTANLTIKEGVTVSTTIPVSLEVKNFTLPDQPTFPVIIATGGGNINLYHQNDAFPPVGDPYRTTRKHYYQFFRRHGLIPVGDNQFEYNGETSQVDYPTEDYAPQLDGTLFSTANGYAGRGVDTPVPFYMIGTYRAWDNPTYWSTTSTGGATGFCTNISSWSFNMGRDYPGIRTAFYTYDEPDDTTLHNTVEKYATWMSTVCPMSGTFINSFVTALWTHVASSATHINMPATTGWIGSGFPNSEATWTGLSTTYETQGTTQAWAYNGHPSWSGSMFATEDTGISPMVFSIAAWKKGVQGWFLWNGTNFSNSNNAPSHNNDLFNDAKTFGEDIYPSTSAARGRYGNSYSNGDGVLSYPGTDLQDVANNYNFDGPMASLRLKLVRASIQYYDYLNMANTVNPTSVTAIVANLLPEVLWEHACFNDATGVDCSYSYGGRQWTDDPQPWEVNRELLADMITQGSGTSVGVKGQTKLKGSLKLK